MKNLDGEWMSEGYALGRAALDLILIPIEVVTGLPSFATGLYLLNNVESDMGYFASGALTLLGAGLLIDAYRRKIR